MTAACILTTYSLTTKGYGQLKFQGKMQRHHRVAYCLANNVTLASIAASMVLHSCDNPACVNPDHLRLGTALDNSLDMKARGRTKLITGSPKGLRVSLNASAIADIQNTPGAHRLLAARYGVSQGTITNIKANKGLTALYKRV